MRALGAPLDKVIPLRVCGADLEKIRKAAARERRTVPNWMRNALLDALAKDSKKEKR
jgi:hypothetical protein